MTAHVESRPAMLPHSDRVSVLVTVFAVLMGYYLALDPVQPWALLLLAGLVGFGVDGVVRSQPGLRFEGPVHTVSYLVAPVLYTIAIGIFLRDATSGYWSLASAALAAVLLGAITYAELLTATSEHPLRSSARLLLGLISYVAAFAGFAMIYQAGLDLVPAVALVGLLTALLTVEVLRDIEAEPAETLAHAVAIGAVVGEVRWALHFLPIDGYLAGLALLLSMYVACGLMHSYMAGHLSWLRGAEYAAVGVAGSAVVITAKIIGSS